MSDFFNLMAANAVAVRAPISGQTGVWVYNSNTLTASAIKMSGVVVSGRSNSMTVLSKGKSYDTLARNSARLYVSAGGYVESTTMSSTTISCAGSAVDTFLSGGTMYVSNGGVATNVQVLRNARLTVSSGAVATNVTVVSSGNVNATVYGNDSVTLIDGTNERGSFFLSGGTASNFLLFSLGMLTVSSGGTALGTVVNGGSLTVTSGGTALETEWRPGVGNLNVSPGGVAPVNLSGIYFASTFQPTVAQISSSMYLSGFSGSRIWIFSGGTASDCYIESVCSGGYAENCSCNSSCLVYSGGSVNSCKGGNNLFVAGIATSVSDFSRVNVERGGCLGATVVGAFTSISVSSGGSASGIVENGGGVYVSEGAVVNFTPNVISGGRLGAGSTYDATIHSGTIATSCIVYGKALTIYPGGLVKEVNAANIDVGRKVRVEGALIGYSHITSVFKGTLMEVGSGGVVSDVILSNYDPGRRADGATFTVSSGGTAVNVYNDMGGTIVSNGGYVSMVVVDNSRTISVCSGGTALGVVLSNGATAVVDDGGYIEYVN